MVKDKNADPIGAALRTIAKERILVMDGAMGTQIQDLKLDEAGFRGERFKDWTSDLRGNKDRLILTRPEAIQAIHEAYLLAGADIVETNTFSSTSIAQADYGMADLARELNVAPKLLERSLNQDFSGGEKKKLELLQMCLLDPSLMIFDEIDTGVDVDSLKTIARSINRMHTPNKTLILITHYNRILQFLKPDAVLVLIDGKLVKHGSHKLADTIESKGYDALVSRAQTSRSKPKKKAKKQARKS